MTLDRNLFKNENSQKLDRPRFHKKLDRFSKNENATQNENGQPKMKTGPDENGK